MVVKQSFNKLLLLIIFCFAMLPGCTTTPEGQNNTEPAPVEKPETREMEGNDTVNDGGYQNEGGALDPDLHDTTK